MSIARWNPKAVCGCLSAHGKPLTGRTGIAYEAATRDEEAKTSEVRYLHGRCGCICGGYKWEGRASYPGRSDNLLFNSYRCREGPGGIVRSQQRP